MTTECMDTKISTPHAVELSPRILYMGTPVVLVSTMNEEGTPNLAPMSSAWALGWTMMLGLGRTGQTLANLERSGECVLPTNRRQQQRKCASYAYTRTRRSSCPTAATSIPMPGIR
ncbi:MAG TPA: flavin reductase [Gemmatimonadaceae bacterium]|jgi:Conserved protein/domain typically associated with flavoprotein oxygenases, DIM6/NTAB family